MQGIRIAIIVIYDCKIELCFNLNLRFCIINIFVGIGYYEKVKTCLFTAFCTIETGQMCYKLCFFSGHTYS